MTTYSVLIDSVENQYFNVSEAVKAIKFALYEISESEITLCVDDPRGQVWDSSESEGDLNEFLIEEIAMYHDLETINTVEGGHNGYPSGMEMTLTGFSSWEEASQIATDNGLQLVWLHRREGWQAWERTNSADAPAEISPEDFGYENMETCSAQEFFESERDCIDWANDFETLADMKEYLERIEAVCDLLEEREENQVVLYSMDNDEPRLAEKKMISWSCDSSDYCLGAVAL